MTDLIERLEQAVNGLFFPSESDEPLRVFVWREAVPFSLAALIDYAGYDAATPIETTDLDTLFRSVATPQDWYGAEEHARTERFQALVDLLNAELSDIDVYRIGEIAIDVYVVGRAADGTAMGVTTRLIET